MNETLVDPDLPQLARALDHVAMTAGFRIFLQREYPERDLDIQDCVVEAVRHKRGKRCRITYRLAGTEAGAAFERRLTCRLLAADRSPDRYLDGAPDELAGCASWRPASWWPEMRMAIHVFPYDPKLSQLARLLDPELVRAEIDQRLPSWGWPGPWRAERVEILPIKYRSGRRCLMRYDVPLVGAAGEQDSLSFFGKTYQGAQSRYVYEALLAVREGLGDEDLGFDVPRPLAHIDPANTVWQETWPGEGPRKRAARLGWERCLDAATLDRVAALIAAVHQTKPSDGLLQPASSAAFLIENARGDLEDIRGFLLDDSQQAAALARIFGLLESAVPEPPAQPRTLHGTFKLAQLLCRDDRVALVDFDSVSAGDPMLDIGEFVASLVHLGPRDGVDAALVEGAIDRFVSGYARAVPWECDRGSLAWYTTVFLLGKTHSLFKKHDAVGVANAPLAFRGLEAWAHRAAGEAG